MADSIKVLADAIKAVEDCPEIEYPEDRYLTNGEPHDLVETAESEACGALICSDGQANFKAMAELKERFGYIVKPGETDSFGWLTGIVCCSKGMIVYG